MKREFGSWFAALIGSGQIPDGSQQMARGIRTIAIDGHVCLSLGERMICDLLHLAEIDHSREPRYPESRMRADFLIGDTYVEYLGLAGDAEYDAKTDRKVDHARQHGLHLELIKPGDLASPTKLESRLRGLAKATSDNPSETRPRPSL